MDIDWSIQTRQLNYKNRSQFEAGKSPPISITNDKLNKRQRNFNIQTTTDNQTNTSNETTIENYEQAINENSE